MSGKELPLKQCNNCLLVDGCPHIQVLLDAVRQTPLDPNYSECLEYQPNAEYLDYKSALMVMASPEQGVSYSLTPDELEVEEEVDRTWSVLERGMADLLSRGLKPTSIIIPEFMLHLIAPYGVLAGYTISTLTILGVVVTVEIDYDSYQQAVMFRTQ